MIEIHTVLRGIEHGSVTQNIHLNFTMEVLFLSISKQEKKNQMVIKP